MMYADGFTSELVRSASIIQLCRPSALINCFHFTVLSGGYG